MITEVRLGGEDGIVKIYENGSHLISIPFEVKINPCSNCKVGRLWCTRPMLGSDDIDYTFKKIVCEKLPIHLRPTSPGTLLYGIIGGRVIKKLPKRYENISSNNTSEREEERDD